MIPHTVNTDPRNAVTRLFIPRYDEMALFLMSLAFVLVFFTNGDLRSKAHQLIVEDKFDPRIYIALGLFVAGILFSLYHAFTMRQKSDGEKVAMLFFAVFVNGFSGIEAGTHMLEDSHGILLVFPLWNIINGGLLLLLYRFHVIDESSIVDDNVTLLQIVLGSVVVVAALVVCRFYFEMYWAITFSICVSYATNINGIVLEFFPLAKRKKRANYTILERMR